MASDHPEHDAWDALVRSAFRRTWRGRLRVTDDPRRRRQAALWGLVHVLWAATDLRDLGFEVPLGDLIDLVKTFRRGAGFAAKPRTRRRYFDDNAWLGLVALALPEPEPARSPGVRADGRGPERWDPVVRGRHIAEHVQHRFGGVAGSRLDDDAFALRAMEWLNVTLRGPDGLYADHVDGAHIDRRVFSYNQGASIAALRMLGRTSRRTQPPARRSPCSGTTPAARTAAVRRDLDPRAGPSRGSARGLEPDRSRRVERLLREALDPGSGLSTRGGLGSYDRTTTIDQAAIVQILAMRSEI